MAATTDKVNQKWFETALKKVAKYEKTHAMPEVPSKDNNNNTSVASAGKIRFPTDIISKRGGSTANRSVTSTDGAEERRKENARLYVDPVALEDLYFYDFKDQKLQEAYPDLRIKLIISAIGMKQPKQPILNRVGKITGIAKLGAVHTALQIGPVVLEWDVTSLVYIIPSKEFDNFKALAAIDLDSINIREFNENFMKSLCQMIAKWNGKMKYSQTDANCQTFTEAVLDLLKLKNPFKGQTKIKKFIDNLDELDRKEVPFVFDFQGTEVIFKDHQSLDAFCWKNMNALPPGGEDMRLLKAFDRVFWLRYYAAMNGDQPDKVKLLDKFGAMENTHGEPNCYFMDPAGSATYWAPKEGNNTNNNADSTNNFTYDVGGADSYHAN